MLLANSFTLCAHIVRYYHYLLSVPTGTKQKLTFVQQDTSKGSVMSFLGEPKQLYVATELEKKLC